MSDRGSERRYQGLTASERSARRRAAILSAALELFGTAGYHATPVKQICRSSGLTERYFYESFTDREDCLATLYDELVSCLRAATTAAIEAARTTPAESSDAQGQNVDRVTAAALDAFVRHLADDPRRARVVLIEVVGVSEAMERRRHRVLREFTDVVTAVWADTDPATLPPHPRLTATALAGGVNHLLVDWLMDGRRATPDVLIDVCTGLFTAARTVPPQ